MKWNILEQYVTILVMGLFIIISNVIIKSLESKLSDKTYKGTSYEKVIKHISNLEELKRNLILEDFKKISFFTGKNSKNLAQLLRYIQEVGRKDTSFLESRDSSYDKVIIILINFQSEFYQYYHFCHQEEERVLWSIRKDYYNNSVRLSKKLISSKLKQLQS